MNFTAVAFVLGFPLVLLLHWLCPPAKRWLLLLAASIGFYAIGSPQSLGLLAAITVGTYTAALRMERCKTRLAKKIWCVAALVLCFGCLAWFKYAGLFSSTAAALLGRQAPVLEVVLPAGISFYTFQTLTYVLDVYRGVQKTESHFGHYALFVCFFPQLVAGPIERTGDLLPQLKEGRRSPDWNGALVLLRGFAKKLLLADAMAPFVDRIYGAPDQATGPAMVLATVMFAGQIYFDFSGYSDIAVGVAALLGIKLSRNFDHPYAAGSIREFWRRWHISLTRWFTDYLYIPLGGSRCGELRHYCNLLLVFLASGLWHGAAWHFVLWGALHGCFLVAESWWSRHWPARVLPPWAERLRTLILVCVAWVFFRADSIPAAWQMLTKLPAGWSAETVKNALWMVGSKRVQQILLAGVCLRCLPERIDDRSKWPTVLFWLTIAVVVTWFSGLTADNTSAFLYFQF